MKRTYSETHSDSEIRIFESEKGSPSPSYPVNARKKRRGIIEKRRRDRINNSLAELRRLVPAAFEKQGNSKLEKAEILQYTVEHIKMLHATKGLDSTAAHAYSDFSVEYHRGFRECSSEVARYLVTVEGLDVQDPLRLRLMGHLQCVSSASASASASATAASAWPQYHHHGQHSTAAADIPTSSSSTCNSSSSAGSAVHPYSTQFVPVSYASLPVLSPNNGQGQLAYSAFVSKPYRPWGSELVY